MSLIEFKIEKNIPGSLGRAGILKTAHGEIQTPSFAAVGTKATVKALSPEQVRQAGIQVVLANTYHLYMQPGDLKIRQIGGLHNFMNWQGPIMTDSGGFQVFSLGAAYGKNISKITKENNNAEILLPEKLEEQDQLKIAEIDEDGVAFKSPIDGKIHYFTPERSMEIQHNLGADIFFAFDECTSPQEPHSYQREALDRTHRWAKRSLEYHKSQNSQAWQALFGIVQGGRFEELRKESASVIGKMDFDGFGIGGSFAKEDMGTAVEWVNNILPQEKPRHLLGIGEPVDILMGIERGIDLFDCVLPTRMGRNGTLYTKHGRINVLNSKYGGDFSPIDEDCLWDKEQRYSKAYLSHLFRAKEMYAATLASLHNLSFISNLLSNARESILEGRFSEYKENFISNYCKN